MPPRGCLAVRAVRSVLRRRLDPTDARSKRRGARPPPPAPRHRGDPHAQPRDAYPTRAARRGAARRVRLVGFGLARPRLRPRFPMTRPRVPLRLRLRAPPGPPQGRYIPGCAVRAAAAGPRSCYCPPVARGEGGDTGRGGGKGGGEARRWPGPAGRGRRAVPRARGPGRPRAAGGVHTAGGRDPEAGQLGSRPRAGGRGRAACGRSRSEWGPGPAPFLSLGLSFPPGIREVEPNHLPLV